MRFAFAPILIVLSAAASAASLPEFDIKALCGAGQSQDPSSRLAAEECADNERVARDLLQRSVAALSEESVQQCAKMVSEGPAGSYLALLGCIEQSKKAAGEATRDGPPQSPPGIATQGSSPSALAGSALAPNQTDISPRAEQVKSSNIASTPSSFHFSHDLGLHLVDPEVKQLQIFLNRHGFPVAADGPGSPGHEVEIFGRGTKAALELFQRAHAKEIAITQATGHFGAATRKYINHF